MNKIDKRSLHVVLIVAVLGFALLLQPGCDEPDFFTQCTATVGRRPCMKGSMRYDSKKKECSCATVHRGKIKWDLPKKR